MSDQSTGYMELVEALAALEHRQWMHWTQSLAEREDLPDHLVERWEENWVPYGELDDETKDHDRVWAKAVVELLNEHDVCEIAATEETGDVSGLHPNPQMQKYQLLAAGETVDLVYFGDGDASLLEAGSATLREGWVDGRDGGGNEISYPSRRVGYVRHNFEIPEIETAEDQSGDTGTAQSKDGDLP